DWRRKGSSGTALEEEEFPGPGAGDEVDVPVAVEVHQLWTEADASARGHTAILMSIFESESSRQLRLSIRAFVAVDPQQAFAELPDEEILDTVAIEVTHERSRMADGGVDELAAGLETY